MFRLIGGISYLFFGLIAAMFAQHSLGNHFGGTKAEVVKYERLLNEGVSLFAKLDSITDETQFKIKGIEVHTYKKEYSFKVADKTYSGDYYFDHPDSLKSDSIIVFYLPDEPSFNEEDVERKLEQSLVALNSKSDLHFGLGAVLVSLLLLVLGIKSIQKTFRTNNLS